MENLVIMKDQQAVTTSLQVAEGFEKEHRNVTRDIENLKKDVLNFEQMFFESEEPDSYGRPRKIYLMNKDGFALLAMGFTGNKALQFKLKYIEAFNQMEKAVKGIYHISETALTNNIMDVIEEKLFQKIDERLETYEENFRPTHANKLNINNYIKCGLGVEREPEEVDLVKQRVLLMLDADSWQDVPYKKLIGHMRLIDESIKAVKNFRTKKQLDLFDSYL